MKYSGYLLFSLILNVSCGLKNDEHPADPVLIEPTVEPIPEDPKPVGPLFMEQIPVDTLQKLRELGCTITNEAGVVTCEQPASFEAGEALFIQLRALHNTLLMMIGEVKIQPELYEIWCESETVATRHLEETPIIAARLKTIDEASKRVESATGARVSVSFDRSYTERLRGIAILDELIQSPEFLAETKRLQIGYFLYSDQNFYYRGLGNVPALSWDGKGDAATLKAYVKGQQLK